MTAAGGGNGRSCALTIDDDDDDDDGDGDGAVCCGGVEGAGFPIQTQSIVNVTIEKMRNFPNPSEKKL